MTTKRRLMLKIAAVLVLAQPTAWAAVSAVAPALQAFGWEEEITFDGKVPNRFTACDGDCVRVETDNSVSMIGRPVNVDLTRTPRLSWEWKIEQPVAASDLTKKGADDRAVAVYVTFPYDPARAGLVEKLLRPLVELARGEDAPSRMLSYVWAGFGERGVIIESPFFGGVNCIVITRTATDAVDQWVMEKVDVAADHERAFGRKPTQAAHVLISADSDDTGTRSRAFVRNIRFGSD